MSDSISDFITIIRNASRAGKEQCEAKYSKLHWKIAKILQSNGFINQVKESKDKNGFKNIQIALKYVDESSAITDIQRYSKSGRRLYFKSKDIPYVLDGLGIAILNTSQGVIKDKDARRNGIGGEVICTVW